MANDVGSHWEERENLTNFEIGRRVGKGIAPCDKLLCWDDEFIEKCVLVVSGSWRRCGALGNRAGGMAAEVAFSSSACNGKLAQFSAEKYAIPGDDWKDMQG